MTNTSPWNMSDEDREEFEELLEQVTEKTSDDDDDEIDIQVIGIGTDTSSLKGPQLLSVKIEEFCADWGIEHGLAAEDVILALVNTLGSFAGRHVNLHAAEHVEKKLTSTLKTSFRAHVLMETILPKKH